ncbi:PDR/VanB family oxidoreductase [Hydrogenophaga sp. BPS33]|uniref:PDR/VanB family oxidoreductase n=1 Tax=Hydrogenophaga sp. BPS33 TaxID=2651974 RepID=UPI00135B9DE2|nr:PDR/VanB family oxidoreductase [Hydrogenophaga sp. BPS33]
MTQKLLEVTLSRVWQQTEEIRTFELSPTEGALPSFEAGAHIDIYTDVGPRPYSLCHLHVVDGPYVVGIKREPDGRGASRWLHDTCRVGHRLQIGPPRNNFRLAPQAAHHCLMAGGIGITPVLAMAKALWQRGSSFELVCFFRGRSHAPFLEEMRTAPWNQRVRFHFDDSPAHQVHLDDLCAAQPVGTHFYACGPAGFMAAVRQATRLRPPEQVHQESFSALPAAEKSGRTTFTVELARSGKTVLVEHGESLLQALRRAGHPPITSCEMGVCGSCVTRYLSGTPVHADAFLSADERLRELAICCAGSLSERLVLDL